MVQTSTGADGPAPDDEPSGPEGETVVPPPRAAHPLPRRIRGRDPAAGRVPDGRRSGAADEATLNRLLIGLREI